MKRIFAVTKRTLLAVSCVVLIGSCSAKKSVENSSGAENLRKLSCIAVLPVKGGSPSGIGQSKAIYDGARFVDSVLFAELHTKENVKLVSSGVFDEIADNSSGLRNNILTTGEQFGCDGIMVVDLLQYRQRVGGEYGVEEPAAAAFDMRIVDGKNGSVIWDTSYSETQESLFSNILSFWKAEKRGFKWITVEELVRQAVKGRLEECPYL